MISNSASQNVGSSNDIPNGPPRIARCPSAGLSGLDADGSLCREKRQRQDSRDQSLTSSQTALTEGLDKAICGAFAKDKPRSNRLSLRLPDSMRRGPIWGGKSRIMDPVLLNPLIALIAGILILLMHRLLNYVVAIYLIAIGVIGLAQHLQ